MSVTARLDEIRYSFFEEHGSAGNALDLLRRVRAGRSRRDLENLLRHHEEKEISDGETWTRDDFDFLIAFFAMVEVARLSRFVSDRLPPTHLRQARMVLATPAVRTYYEDNYPLFLPQAHLLFAEGNRISPDEGVAPEGARLFARFFALSQPLEMGDSLETILWFLDGGARDGYDIDDVLEVIASPRDFVEYVSDRADDYEDDELGTLAAAVQGLVEFLRFIPTFHRLLEDAEPYPMLQSAFWHYHGYWFQQLSLYAGTNVRLAIDALVEWEGGGKHRRRLRREDRIRRVAFEQQLTALSSGRYRWRLVEAIGRKC